MHIVWDIYRRLDLEAKNYRKDINQRFMANNIGTISVSYTLSEDNKVCR